MRFILISLLLLAACAHKPDSICDCPFDFKDKAFDLDGSGTVTTLDYSIYLKTCGDGR